MFLSDLLLSSSSGSGDGIYLLSFYMSVNGGELEACGIRVVAINIAPCLLHC